MEEMLAEDKGRDKVSDEAWQKVRKVGREEGEKRTLRDMHCMPRKPSPLPHQSLFLRQQLRHLPADQFIPHRLMTIWVQAPLIAHLPRATARAVVVTHALFRSLKARLVRVEGVAVLVLRTTHGSLAGTGIDLINCVFRAVDVRVYAHAEEMLVVVRVDAGVDLCAPAMGVFARVHGVGVQNPRQLDLELDGAVLVEDPVDGVLVIRGGEDMRDQQLSASCDDYAVVAEIGVFEEDACIFFVDADGVFDRLGGSGAVDEGGVHVVDCAFAVAAEGKAVGHIATTVFA